MIVYPSYPMHVLLSVVVVFENKVTVLGIRVEELVAIRVVVVLK